MLNIYTNKYEQNHERNFINMETNVYGKEFKNAWKPCLLTESKEIDKEQICNVTA